MQAARASTQPTVDVAMDESGELLFRRALQAAQALNREEGGKARAPGPGSQSASTLRGRLSIGSRASRQSQAQAAQTRFGRFPPLLRRRLRIRPTLFPRARRPPAVDLRGARQ